MQDCLIQLNTGDNTCVKALDTSNMCNDFPSTSLRFETLMEALQGPKMPPRSLVEPWKIMEAFIRPQGPYGVLYTRAANQIPHTQLKQVTETPLLRRDSSGQFHSRICLIVTFCFFTRCLLVLVRLD